MRYAIVIEKLESNYSAYVPDLLGCVATGATLEEIEQQIKEAIAFHLDGLREEGLPIHNKLTNQILIRVFWVLFALAVSSSVKLVVSYLVQ